MSAARRLLAAAHPPRARQHPRRRSLHGDERVDEYAWLRERDNPRVLAHLHAENAHEQAWLAPHAALERQLFREMRSRMAENDDSVPWRYRGYWYQERYRRGQQYPSYWRWPDAPGARARRLLDLNTLAAGREYLDVGEMEVSPDNRLLAYSLDETGALDYTLHLLDLKSQRVRRWKRLNTDSIAWSADSAHLFYVTKDAAKRAHRVWRAEVGGNGSAPDVLIYQEEDERYWVDVSTTLDGRYIVITSQASDTTELRVIDAHQPTAAPRTVLRRKRGREAQIAHREGIFFLVINDTGPQFRLISVDAKHPLTAAPREWVAHRESVTLEELEVFSQHLVLVERHRGVCRLRIYSFAQRRWHTVAFKEKVYTVDLGVNAEFDTPWLRLDYTSMVTPPRVIDYHMAQHRQVLRKQQSVGGGFDARRYACTQITARAADGTRVPISLVWRRGATARLPRHRPLLLEGYGAYGIPNDVYFSSTRLSLLDRGVVVGIAHVRGGGDGGRPWYDAGKLAHKMNSFSDFVACARTLIRTGWTQPDRLIIEGGSAGGLLVGAAANLAPELFAAVVAEVPFLDVLNTMLDPTLPLTVGEYLEWGNPHRRRDYAVIRAYSPYDNLRAAAYPAMYLRTSLYDSQVPYWEAVKYAARLRRLRTNEAPVLVAIHMAAGHAGSSGRYDALRERARTLLFMLLRWQQRLTPPSTA